MKSHLKIKVQTLGAECRVAKSQERQWLRKAKKARAKQRDPKYAEANWFSIRQHRLAVIRKEARDSHLALGFLRGRSYEEMENVAYHAPDWKNIEGIVKRFSADDDQRDIMQTFSQWKDTAEAYQKAALEIQLAVKVEKKAMMAAEIAAAAS